MNGLEVKMEGRYKDLPKMSVTDLESEVNFYQWLVDNENNLGGVEMKHRVWLEALKIEIKKRGLIMERKLKLIEGDGKWEES